MTYIKFSYLNISPYITNRNGLSKPLSQIHQLWSVVFHDCEVEL